MDEIATNQADADLEAGVAEEAVAADAAAAPEAAAEDPDETEEVERGGKTYRVPKALKGELMMHADYTRKTQEVAATRRALEQRAVDLAEAEVQTRAALGEHVAEVAQLHGIEAELARLGAVDW